MRDKATTIAGVCDALLQGDRAAASAMARTNYPFAPGSNAGRKYTEYQLTRIFLRHIVYWELYPTIDHVYPVARGGLDDETNWVTTSMVRNSAKSNWTLEELGWTLLELPLVNAWDGLTPWFLCYLERDQTHFDDRYIRKWHNAAVRAMAGQKPFGA